MKLYSASLVLAVSLCLSAAAFAAEPAGPAKGAPGAAGMQPKKELTEEQKKKFDAGRDNLLKFINDRLKHRFTPVVQSVAMGAAAAGRPVSVSVKTGYDTKTPVDKITEVKIFFSLDGGKNWENEAALKKSGAAWTGAIPPIKKKGNVLYYVRVKDSDGNVTADLPCNVSAWPPLDDPCMIDMGSDPEPVDDPTAKTPDDFDLWEVRAGMDVNYLYVQMSVEGEIAKGSMNPVKITSYNLLMVEPNALKELADASVFMQAENDPALKKKLQSKEDMVRMASYTPMAPAMNNKMKACFMGYSAAGTGKMDDKSISCKRDGPDLFMRIDRKALGKHLGAGMTMIGGMIGYLDNMDVPIPKITDVASFANFKFNPRTFAVK